MRPMVCSLLAAFVVLTGCASSGGKGSGGGDSAHDPLYSLTLMRQGSVLLQQQRYDEALAQFEAADHAAPGNATVHNMMGLCYFKLGDTDHALAEFNRALDLAPSFTDARNNRGSVYLADGELRQAEVDFVAVLADSTYPHRWQVTYNLGVTYLKQGRLAAAEENFRRVVASADPVFDAYLRLAEIAETREHPEVAVDLLEEARLKFPDRPEAALALGRLLIADGRIEDGNRLLREVVASAPDSDEATQARQLMHP